MPNKFKINDIVTVVNAGTIYPSHEEMAKRLKATKWVKRNYIGTAQHLNGRIGVVKNFADNMVCIYLVDLGQEEIIIGEHGITLAKNVNNVVYRKSLK